MLILSIHPSICIDLMGWRCRTFRRGFSLRFLLRAPSLLPSFSVFCRRSWLDQRFVLRLFWPLYFFFFFSGGGIWQQQDPAAVSEHHGRHQAQKARCHRRRPLVLPLLTACLSHGPCRNPLIILHPLIDMSGRVDDLSPKQAEALEQVHELAFWSNNMHQICLISCSGFQRSNLTKVRFLMYKWKTHQ